MKRKDYPEYHKALLDPATYSVVAHKVKFAESHSSLLYKTGSHVYKIRKSSPIYSSLAIKEAFAYDAKALGRAWAPQVEFDVLPLSRGPEGRFVLGGEGAPCEHVLRMTQLSGHHWLDYLIANGRVSSALVGRLARFLATRHRERPAAGDDAERVGRPEHFRELFDEIVYQSRKYTHTTVTEPMLELVTRPTTRFLEEFRRLFPRRVRKGRIVDGHGAFVPEHIHVRGKEVAAVAVLDAQSKYRILDAANDVATLLNEFQRAELQEQSALFVKRYVSSARDRDLEKLLPVYRAFQAMRCGLVLSERIAEKHDPEDVLAQLSAKAQSYFADAVHYARQIPRE